MLLFSIQILQDNISVVEVLCFSGLPSKQFDSPVVSAWMVDKGDLKEVDLFSGLQWNHDRAHGHLKSMPLSPSLYVGMHRKQVRT